MARPLARALAGGAAAAVLTAPIMLAAPAQAAGDTPGPSYAGATSAFALRLQINLPKALEALTIDLQIDPVTGTLTSSAGGAATATGQVLGSDKGLLKTVLDAATPLKGISTADLDNPGPNSNSPVPALPAPLNSILSLGLIESSAQVSETSSSSSASVARLGLALGDTLSQAAAPLVDGLDTLQNTLITTIAGALPALTTPLCDPVTTIANTVLAPLGLSQVVVSTVCDLDTLLVDVSGEVSKALQSLGDNIFNLGLIQTSQSIVEKNGVLTAKANASIAGLGLLGSGPLGTAGVIQSSATATANGVKGGATAVADAPVVFDLKVAPLAGLVDLKGTLTGILGEIGNGTLTAPLTTLVDQLLDTVNGLLEPIGASVVALDDSNSAVALTSCPTALTGLQKGTFTSTDGTCAAAATRGIGIEVTLPQVLAAPLGITGPFISLALSPSAAVAQAQVAPPKPVAPPEPVDQTITQQLPRTGMESGLAGAAALAALGGAAYLRRRSLANR